MYNLTHLKTFVKVAELGSFTRYAEEAFLSTNAVMKQIDNLEKELDGIKLFERSNKGSFITPAGRILYEEAVKILKLCEDAQQRVIAESSSDTLKIRMAIPANIAYSEVSKILKEVKLRNPRMHFEKVAAGISTNEHFVHGKRLDEQTDVILDTYSENLLRYYCNEYSALKIKSVPVCCILSINHRLSGEKQLSTSDLSGETIHIPYSTDEPTIQRIKQLLKNESDDTMIVEHEYYTGKLYDECSNGSCILIDAESNMKLYPPL